jgi:hypothetical protein
MLTLVCLSLACCGALGKKKSDYQLADKNLHDIGFTIQTGAFRDVANAVAVTDKLHANNINATYFKASDNLFKVRLGSFATHELALQRAQSLEKAGVIQGFYIVEPGNFTVSHLEELGEDYIREELVKTAETFVGTRYLWGGISPKNGFDCSGLTMTVYQLNGMDMPRTAYAQRQASNEIYLSDIKKGDLLFYHTNRRRKLAVTHVGIYAGDGQFIHAPGRGKRIRYESLDSKFYKKRFVGVGSFL